MPVEHTHLPVHCTGTGLYTVSVSICHASSENKLLIPISITGSAQYPLGLYGVAKKQETEVLLKFTVPYIRVFVTLGTGTLVGTGH